MKLNYYPETDSLYIDLAEQRTLHPPGSLSDWDGLMSWFVRRVEENPTLLKVALIARWNRAARDAGAR